MLATRTFLCSDLRDYTRFVETHGDVAATTLIGDYRRIVRAEIAKHEGAEVKTEGDSFYVVFPGTRVAVAAAQGILREAELVRGLLPREGAQLTERAGLTLKGLDDPPRVFSVACAATAIAPVIRWLQRGDGEWYLRRIETSAAERGVPLPA